MKNIFVFYDKEKDIIINYQLTKRNLIVMTARSKGKLPKELALYYAIELVTDNNYEFLGEL